MPIEQTIFQLYSNCKCPRDESELKLNEAVGGWREEGQGKVGACFKEHIVSFAK